jgi:quercetin 2,3-dioxygenase
MGAGHRPRCRRRGPGSKPLVLGKVVPGADHTAIAYVAEGEVDVGPENDGHAVGRGRLALLGPGDHLRLQARHQRSEVFIAVARPLNEPIARRGPFVMNTEAEIRQAYADYRAGHLALP